MSSLQWKVFETKNENNLNKAFEDLSFEIIKSSLNINSNVVRFKNQQNIEMEPFLLKGEIDFLDHKVSGEIGFQSKYIDTQGDSFDSFMKQIEKSFKLEYEAKTKSFSGITKIKKNYPCLKFIIVFCNIEHTRKERYKNMTEYLKLNNIYIINFFRANFEVFFLDNKNKNIKNKYFEQNISSDIFENSLNNFSQQYLIEEFNYFPLYENKKIINKIIKNKKNILFIKGEKGVGKTTLIKQFQKQNIGSSLSVNFEFIAENKHYFLDLNFFKKKEEEGLKFLMIDNYDELSIISNLDFLTSLFNLFFKTNIKIIIFSKQRSSFIAPVDKIDYIEMERLPESFIQSLDICSKTKDNEEIRLPQNLFNYYNKNLLENKIDSIKSNSYIFDAINSNDFSHFCIQDESKLNYFIENSILKENEFGKIYFFNAFVENYYYLLLIKSLKSKSIIDLFKNKFKNSSPFKSGLNRYLKTYEITDYDNLFYDILDLDDSFNETKKESFINIKKDYLMYFIENEVNVFSSIELLNALLIRTDLEKDDYLLIYNNIKDIDLKENNIKNTYIEMIFADLFTYLDENDKLFLINKILLSHFDFDIDFSFMMGIKLNKTECLKSKNTKFFDIPFLTKCFENRCLFFNSPLFDFFILLQIHKVDITLISYAMINKDFYLFEEIIRNFFFEIHKKQELIEQDDNKEIYNSIITITKFFFNINKKRTINIINKQNNELYKMDCYESKIMQNIVAKNKHIYSIYKYNYDLVDFILSEKKYISLLKNKAHFLATNKNKKNNEDLKKTLENKSFSYENSHHILAGSLILFENFEDVKSATIVLNNFIKNVDDFYSCNDKRFKDFYINEKTFYHFVTVFIDFINSLNIKSKDDFMFFENFIKENLKSSLFFNRLLTEVAYVLIEKNKDKKINSNIFIKYLLKNIFHSQYFNNEDKNKDFINYKLNSISNLFYKIDFNLVLKSLLNLYKQNKVELNKSESLFITFDNNLFLLYLFEFLKEKKIDLSILENDYFQRRFLLITKKLFFKLKKENDCSNVEFLSFMNKQLNSTYLNKIMTNIKIEDEKDMFILCDLIKYNDVYFDNPKDKKILEFYIDLFFNVENIDKSNYNNIIQEKLDKNNIFSPFKRNECFRELLKNKENKYDSNMIEYLVKNEIKNIDKDINYLFLVSHYVLESKDNFILTNENLYLEKILNKDFFENEHYIKNKSKIKKVLIYFHKKTDSKIIKNILDCYF